MSVIAEFGQAVNAQYGQGPLTFFRNNLDVDAYKSYILTDKGISGLFTFDPTDTQSADDGLMTLIKESKRFKRNYTGFASSSFFKAVGDGVFANGVWTGTDNTAALQAALDFAGDRGMGLQIEEGTFLVSNKLRAKKVNGKSDYRLTIQGKGKGVSVIQGIGDTLLGKNILEFVFTDGDSTDWVDSYVRINNLRINAGKAARCVYVQKAINIEIDHNDLRGGTLQCLKVGDGTPDNFACYIHNNYFNGSSYTEGHNLALIDVDSAFAEVYNNVGDGSLNALNCSLGQMYISGNTFEGYKNAGIYSKSSGGGGSKIIGNTLRPYSGYEANGLFTGTMHGIYIESDSGGVASNTIVGNQILMPGVAELDLVINVSNVTSGFISSPHDQWKVTGQSSGAIGRIVGYNPTTHTMQLQVMSGTFAINEVIKQATTNATATLLSYVTRHTFGLSLHGTGGYNVISGNRIGGAEWNIHCISAGNIIVGNSISGQFNGIWVENDTMIIGNSILLAYGTPPYIAVKRTGGNVKFDSTNVYTGIIQGIDPPMFSDITTSDRNALTSPKNGLILFDTSVNKLTIYNGAIWQYIDPFIDKLSSTKVLGGSVPSSPETTDDIYKQLISGVQTWGPYTLNVPFPYGTVMTISGNTSADPWTQQYLFRTDGKIQFRQQIHSYGDWVIKDILTSSDIILGSALGGDIGLVAAGSAPTKAEHDSLITEIRDIKAKLKASGIFI